MSEDNQGLTITDEVKAPEASTLADSVVIARYEYIGALQYAANLMRVGSNNKKLSARNIQRALFAAVDHGITDTKVNFTTEDEARLAGVLAKILDLRTILQADRINQSKEKENGNETNKQAE